MKYRLIAGMYPKALGPMLLSVRGSESRRLENYSQTSIFISINEM